MRPMRFAGCIAFMTILALGFEAGAAEEPAKPKPTAADSCAAAEFHALDFWIGRWRVETPEGDFAGDSHVEPVLSGCALLEHWRGLFMPINQVREGLGVHRYDARTQQWRQAWTDETPGTVDTVGRQEGKAIVYERTSPSGVRSRMSLRPLDDGRVEQKGERWDEATGAWQTTFHLLYSRIEEGSHP